MTKREQLLNEGWQERLQTLTSGNRGRKAAIAAQGMTVVENHVLRDIEYDPVQKGDDLIITIVRSDD